MNINHRLALVAMLFALLMSTASAQRAQTTDELFGQARALAFEGKRQEASDLCGTILDRNPDYVDARILLGRLYAWDKEYDKARRQLAKALSSKPDYTDARLALIDVELWSDHADIALQYADNGLTRLPDNVDLLYRRMRALRRLDRDDEAISVAQQILALEPEREDARRQYYGMLDEALLNKLSADYTYENFDDSRADWHFLSLAYRRFTPIGSVIGRVNLARRFDKNGAQIEVDAYPNLWDKTYAYLNFGVSDSSLFPKFRVGAEIYHNFPAGWEASLGFRHLNFENSNTTIITGSIAKYIGDYWISLRPNWVPESAGDSLSANLSIRRFFGSRYEYAELALGGGIDDEIDTVSNVSEQINSFRIRGELRRRIAPDLILKGKLGLRTEELPFDRRRNSFFIGIGIERYF